LIPRQDLHKTINETTAQAIQTTRVTCRQPDRLIPSGVNPTSSVSLASACGLSLGQYRQDDVWILPVPIVSQIHALNSPYLCTSHLHVLYILSPKYLHPQSPNTTSLLFRGIRLNFAHGVREERRAAFAVKKLKQTAMEEVRISVVPEEEEEEETIRLPWRGQCGRAAAARALCACCDVGYARDCIGSPVRF
jgi:hypothetical protein